MPVSSKLPHRLGILLPSLDRQGKPLPSRSRQRLRQIVYAWFEHAFSGSTADRLQVRARLRGRWRSEDGVAIEEVEEIWAYCSDSQFRRFRSGLVRLAEQVAELADQEAIAILVDAGMEIVVGDGP